MINAKDAILSSIRQHLADSAPFDHSYAQDDLLQCGSVDPIEIDRAELAKTFQGSLEAVGASFINAANEDAASGIISKFFEDHRATRVATSNSTLIRRLFESIDGIECVVNPSKEELFEYDVGVTAAQWGIAETGTLVLIGDEESSRLTSLIPPIHLCVLKANLIRQTLGEVLALVQKDLSKTITLITGASRTSDIELTLAIGVHGPVELYVLVIDN